MGMVRIFEQGLGLYIIAGHLYAYLHLQKSDHLRSISRSLCCVPNLFPLMEVSV
jgi:hypothetical protein